MLDWLIPSAFAQDGAAAAPQGGGPQLFFFFAIIIGIWYFLVIRPQTKQAQSHRDLVNALKKGDKVVMSGGIHGRVATVDDKLLEVDVGKGVKLTFDRDKVVRIESAAGADASTDDKTPKK